MLAHSQRLSATCPFMPDPHPADHSLRDCFALLDDSDPNAAAAQSRLYTGHVDTLTCRHASELDTVLDRMQHALRDGRHAVGLFTYEMGEQLHGIAPRRDEPQVAQVLLFERCERLSTAEVECWLDERAQLENGAQPEQRPAGVGGVRANVSEAQF